VHSEGEREHLNQMLQLIGRPEVAALMTFLPVLDALICPRLSL
jgi:hypothetical protein